MRDPVFFLLVINLDCNKGYYTPGQCQKLQVTSYKLNYEEKIAICVFFVTCHS